MLSCTIEKSSSLNALKFMSLWIFTRSANGIERPKSNAVIAPAEVPPNRCISGKIPSSFSARMAPI